jgi:hypothetical protein
MEEPKVLFILVHGTWARFSAKWTDENSTFSRRLREALPGYDVRITSLKWSSSNSNWLRRKGADKLVEFVTRCAEIHYGYAIFLIGHSHGGTISAMASVRITEHLRGLCCLSTPFIHSGTRLSAPWFIPVAIAVD